MQANAPVPDDKRDMSVLPRLVLLGMVVGAPWLFGAVQPQWQLRMSAVIAGLVLWRLIELLVSRNERVSPVQLPTAILPIVILLLIAAFQLLPRREGMVLQMHHAVLPQYAVDTGASEVNPAGTVSPATTRLATARLFFALSVVLLASQWFVTPPYGKWMCIALAVNGTALGFFGIVQKLSWNGQMFWRVPLSFGGTPFASYVNRNNAAGYLNLCLAGALGLALIVWHRSSTSAGFHRFRSWRHTLLATFAQMGAAQLSVVAMIGVLVASISFSLSRGGIIAMIAGGLGVGIMSLGRYSKRLVFGSLIGAGLLAAGMLYWLGQWGVVDQRLSTLIDPAGAAAGRLEHWIDTWGAVRDFPWFGTGLGTYRYANQPYQAHPAHAWYYNADNQFFEVLVETGAAGLLAFVSGLALTGLASVYLMRRGDSIERQAVGVLGLFAVLSQSVQAPTDFGLLMPANGLLFAIIAGGVCGTASQSLVGQHVPGSIRFIHWQSPLLNVGLQVVLTLCAASFLLEMHAATTATLASDKVDVFDPQQSRLAIVDAELQDIQRALQLRPDDSALHRAAAMMYIGRYRLVALEGLRDLVDAPSMTDTQRWRATSLGSLFSRAAEMKRGTDPTALSNLRSLPEIDQNLLPALQHLVTAQQLCPLIRDVTLQIALLGFLSEDIDEERFVSATLFIAPSTPGRLFEAGVVADTLGHTELAEAAWKRCLTFSTDWTKPIWSLAASQRSRQAILERVVPPNVEVLVTLAESLQDEADRQETVERAARVLHNATDETSERRTAPEVFARLARLQGDNSAAIEWYRLALSEISGRSGNRFENEWRLTLAQLLLDEKRFEEAYREYSLLLKLSSNRQQIQSIEGKMRDARRAERLVPSSLNKPGTD